MSRSLFFTQSSLAQTALAILVASSGVACGDGGGVSTDAGPETGAKDGDTRDRAHVGDGDTRDRHVGHDGDVSDGGADSEAGSSGDAGDGGTPGDAATDGDAGTVTDAAGDGADSSVSDAMDSGSGDASDASEAGATLAVNLGMAGGFVILAETGISTVPTSAVTGDMGISPAAATYITGFSLVADSTNVFSTSPEVTGKVYAADYSVPTPSNLTTAIGDMQAAFTDAAGRPASVVNLGAGNIGGMTLAPGVYNWGTGLLIPTDVTLNGSATDVWIFQIASTLTVSNATSITLSGGALAKNVFWQVSGAVTLGTTSHFEGILLGQTGIVLGTGASINGRMLAQTAVSIDSSAVVQPAP